MPPARTAPALALGGLLAGALVVVAGGRSTVATTTAPTSWFGLIASPGWSPGRPWGWGAVLVAGLLALVALWLAAIRWQRRTRPGLRATSAIAACWLAPFALSPPLISKDVWAYAAHGLMWRAGLDPYRRGIASLAGHGPAARSAVAAVDPTWQHTTSPYGPLASGVESLAARLAGGDPVLTVVLLRVVAVVSVAALAAGAAALAAPERSRGVVLVALNPLVLVQAVGAAHAEAPMTALLLGGLVAASRARWRTAIVLVCLAALVKAPAFAALPALLVVHGAGSRRWWRTAATDLAVAALTLVAVSLVVPDGGGWVRGLRTPGRNHTPVSPAGLLGAGLRAIGSADGDTVARAAALAVAALLVATLAVTTSRRGLPVTVGWSLLALAVLAPVVYPWYLLWGLACLLPVAGDRQRPWLVAASVAATLAAVTGVPTVVTTALDALSVLGGAVLAAGTARRVSRPDRSSGAGPEAESCRSHDPAPSGGMMT